MFCWVELNFLRSEWRKLHWNLRCWSILRLGFFVVSAIWRQESGAQIKKKKKIEKKYVRKKTKKVGFFFHKFKVNDSLINTFVCITSELLLINQIWTKPSLSPSVSLKWSLKDTTADLKICQYLCLKMKITCWRFHIKTLFNFWNMHT